MPKRSNRSNRSKPRNTSSVQASSFDKNLIEDVDGMLKLPNQWTQARNAVNNTVLGDIGELSNEASNYLCAEAPYTIIGSVHLGKDEWAIFSTDDTNSEIGLFEEDGCSYKTIVNDSCLNFNKDNLIKGVGRTTYNCGRQAYWDDGVNPTRLLNIDNVPWIEDCEIVNGCNICVPTNDLDCDKLRLAPLVKDLAFRIERGSSAGEVLNGSYFVVGAYLLNGVRVTDYSTPSNIQPIFNHQNLSASIDIYINEADPEFDEFELMLIQFTNFNTVGHIVGTYSTRQTKITLDSISETWPKMQGVELGNALLVNNPIIEKSDAIFRNGPYLLRTGPSEKLDFNYQPLANQIVTKWVSVEYNADYYRNGGSNTGYMRDEIYSFFIRWVYHTGDKSASYHIPGRPSIPTDVVPVSGGDVIIGDDPIYWKVYNTAFIDPVFPGIGTILDDGGVILGGGSMGYWESSEIYDDDKPQIWNASAHPWSVVTGVPPYTNSFAIDYDLCGQPIKHHKFPDNASDAFTTDMITNHYDPNDGTKIRIMGIQFDNIKVPLDNDGNPISIIEGYEILRGSREGNKTILAKGMINNLREYKTVDKNSTRTHLYANYPYNPTAPIPDSWDANPIIVVDHFLSDTNTEFNPGDLADGDNDTPVNVFNAFLDNDAPLGSNAVNFPKYTNIKEDLVTFHSPETNFRDPFLSGKELKIYGELHGTMFGKFQFPKEHPQAKFVTNTAFLVSAIMGIGYAMLAMEGEKSTRHYAPSTNYGGTYTQAGPNVGSTGMLGISAASASAQATANAAAAAGQAIINNVFSQSILSLLMSALGINVNLIRDNALKSIGQTAGAAGGTGSQEVYTRTSTAWETTPDFLRGIQGIPAFLAFYGEGVDKILNLIYAFTPYKQYALQQISHCFYDGFYKPEVGQMRRHINYNAYLSPELQDFTQQYRINHIYRSRTVAIELDRDLRLPFNHPDGGKDDTQALFSDVWDRGDDEHWENREYINSEFDRPAASHYAAMKQRLDNQYGQILGIRQVPVSTDTTPRSNATSEVLFNGDTYIGRYTEKNTMFFFYDWLKGQPDGAGFNYRLRKMITHPRFWMDTDRFDIQEFLQSVGTIFSANTGDIPGAFDPFMINPALNIDDPTDISTYVANPECNCGNIIFTNDCAAGTSGFWTIPTLQKLCEFIGEIYQLELYIDFLEDCACFEDTGLIADGHCNDENPGPSHPKNDPAYSDPYVYADSGGCKGRSPLTNKEWHPYNNKTKNCTECPGWNNPGDYLEDGTKKWGRKIKRVKRKLKKANKKKNKLLNKIYDDYIDGIDGNKDDFVDELFSGIITPSDKYAFDMRKAPRFRMTVKEAFIYLFNSGTRDFFVESEINIELRDWGEPVKERHYDRLEYTNLRELYSTDIIKVGNYMKYDYSLSIAKTFNNFVSWGSVQDASYDPLLAETCYTYRPKRLMYSLPQYDEDKKDNWRVFLPFNFKDFNSPAVNIKPIAKTGALILFQNESPAQFPGVDQLQTGGDNKIIIGDGGLFTRQLQSLANAEYPHEYGSCQNRLAVANTPAGLYYMSQNQGKVFQITSKGIVEISNQGLKWWFVKYLPYKLTQHPTAFIDNPFQLQDNPVVGIGCQIIFDNENQIVFFCKKDWIIRPDIADVVTYVSGRNFKVNGILDIVLGDPAYFVPASWTVSYDPKTKGWIGYHDWHPDLVIPTKKTYMTTKGNELWVHADRCDSYCNFYNIDYPFEIEYSLHTKSQVNTLRNVMYFMEVYKYAENCDDRFHVLDFNFDEAIIYNSEQCSGLLKLNITPKNNAPQIVNYPIINFADIDILFSKEEQKYKFNQFWDITDDRGEFNPTAERTIFITEPNGYIKNLNLNNLNYNKFELERKKFRHYKNTVLLRRKVSGNKNIIISLAIQLNLTSLR
jgi:hypothetical protein